VRFLLSFWDGRFLDGTKGGCCEASDHGSVGTSWLTTLYVSRSHVSVVAVDGLAQNTWEMVPGSRHSHYVLHGLCWSSPSLFSLDPQIHHCAATASTPVTILVHFMFDTPHLYTSLARLPLLTIPPILPALFGYLNNLLRPLIAPHTTYRYHNRGHDAYAWTFSHARPSFPQLFLHCNHQSCSRLDPPTAGATRASVLART